MDKLEIKHGSFIQQTQYFIPDSQSGETNVWLRNLKMKVESYLLYRVPGKIISDSDADLDEDTHLRFRVPQNDLRYYIN